MKSGAPPSVSVVIPCYNGAAFLRETLESALGQSISPMEVLVIDDGSVDDSAAIAESFGPPVRVVRQTNRGESVARNRGMDEARGDWIAFLDADDLWRPDKLEKQLAFAHDPSVVAVHTAIYTFGSTHSIFGGAETVLCPTEARPEDRYNVRRICLSGNPCMPSSLLVRRGVASRFPVWTRDGEDAVFTLGLIRCGRIELIAEPLVGYRSHPGQQTASLFVHAKWHRTIETWLSLGEHGLDAADVSALREDCLRCLVEVARNVYWRRRWDDYAALRDYLEKYRDHAEVRELLGRPVYPRFVYAIKDRLDGLLEEREQVMGEGASALRVRRRRTSGLVGVTLDAVS